MRANSVFCRLSRRAKSPGGKSALLSLVISMPRSVRHFYEFSLTAWRDAWHDLGQSTRHTPVPAWGNACTHTREIALAVPLQYDFLFCPSQNILSLYFTC